MQSPVFSLTLSDVLLQIMHGNRFSEKQREDLVSAVPYAGDKMGTLRDNLIGEQSLYA